MEIINDETQRVVAALSHDEALVLFDLLGRWDDSGLLDGERFWQDQAEQRVVWDLLASLEKVVTESFSDTYDNAVSAARRNVRDA